MLTMISPTTRQGSPATISQAQIIVFALMAGIAIFAVVALVVGPAGGVAEGGEPMEPVIPMFPTILVGQGAAAVAAAFFLRGMLAQRVNQRRQEAQEEVEAGIMPNELMTATIVSAAMVESAGLLGCVGCLLEGQVLYLAAPVVSIALMAFWVPSRSMVEGWMKSLS